MMVFLSHLSFLKDSKNIFIQELYNNYLQEGGIGVSFFFILSGFILAYRYQEKITCNQITWKSFYINRIARIYPLHVLTLLIVMVIGFIAGNYKCSLNLCLKALTNFSLCQSFIPYKSIYFSFNSPSWSISDEAFFYLSFPLLIMFIRKIFTKKFNLLLILIALLFLILVNIIDDKLHHAIFYINPLIRILDFILGIYIFNIWQTTQNRSNSPIFYSTIEFISIASLGIFIAYHHAIPKVYKFSFYYWPSMLFIIYSFSFQRGIISKLLSCKICLFLGNISFSFYLTHFWVIDIIKTISSISEIHSIVLSLITSLLISTILYYIFERPMNRYTRYLLNKL